MASEMQHVQALTRCGFSPGVAEHGLSYMFTAGASRSLILNARLETAPSPAWWRGARTLMRCDRGMGAAPGHNGALRVLNAAGFVIEQVSPNRVIGVFAIWPARNSGFPAFRMRPTPTISASAGRWEKRDRCRMIQVN
jgi:hypothetical protein